MRLLLYIFIPLFYKYKNLYTFDSVCFRTELITFLFSAPYNKPRHVTVLYSLLFDKDFDEITLIYKLLPKKQNKNMLTIYSSCEFNYMTSFQELEAEILSTSAAVIKILHGDAAVLSKLNPMYQEYPVLLTLKY